MSAAFPALGTSAVVATADPSAQERAVSLVARELAELDAACSRFRDDSELRTLRRGAHVRVSPLLFDAVAAALDAARSTGGLVDPTVGRTLRLAGYDATFRVVAARDGDAFSARFERAPGWQVVELDEASRTILIPDGVELDLGATAKAFAADRCAQRAAELVGGGVLVSLGGDVAVAGEAPGGGWAVGIADDHAATSVQTTVSIAAGGLATSSTRVRRWRSGDRLLHHLVDPRTGEPPAPCWRTATVAAPTCLDANAASTASIVLGTAAPSWLAARGLHARLVAEDGSVSTVGGWPAERTAA